jgi:hypothetical protein
MGWAQHLHGETRLPPTAAPSHRGALPPRRHLQVAKHGVLRCDGDGSARTPAVAIATQAGLEAKSALRDCPCKANDTFGEGTCGVEMRRVSELFRLLDDGVRRQVFAKVVELAARQQSITSTPQE